VAELEAIGNAYEYNAPRIYLANCLDALCACLYEFVLTSYSKNLRMANTTAFGGRIGLFLLTFFLAGMSVAQNCGGKERWGPKDGTDSQARNMKLESFGTLK
jgi:hypothetical protein